FLRWVLKGKMLGKSLLVTDDALERLGSFIIQERKKTSRAVRSERKVMLGFIYERTARGGSSSLGATVGAGGDPYSEQGSGGRFLPPSSIPSGSSPHFSSWKRDDSYLKWRLFRNSASIIMESRGVLRFFICTRISQLLPPPSLLTNLSSIVEMAKEQPITPEDLDVIREDDMKTIDNLPDLAFGWELRFFCARLLSEKDIWCVPEKWEEPLPGLIPQLFCESACFVAMEKGEEHAPKRARPLEERSILVGSDSSTEDASELFPVGESSTVAYYKDWRRAASS
ncbi:hypothetical protein ACLOJK_027367, partial [Asimina triloba]